MAPKRKPKKKKKTSHKRLFFIIVILILIYIIFNKTNKENDSVSTIALAKELFNNIDTTSYASIDRYIVYGTHLNIEGSIQINENNAIQNVEVIAKNINGQELPIDTEYTYEDDILSFSTLKEINTGLNLETLQTTNYYMFLKLQFPNNETKYYSLKNDTEYGNIEYYTLTRNNANQKININFNTFENIPFLGLNITKVNELPQNVYDVVIDPGHGGNDTGAISGRYEEAEIVLDCAKELKKQLEGIGLKVLITRDGTESPEEYNTYNIYDEEGRVTLANESHAKILISLHLNSNESDSVDGGVEVYAAPNCDLTLAKKLADNIVKTANTEYSEMESYKEENGVYVRTIDVGKSRNILTSRNYNGIFDLIPYLFIIRETGGIATGAYVDGTDSDYSENIYRNSNVGVESYLIELGYINVNKDLNNILRKQNLYMQAIINSIKTFYEIN